MTQSFDAYDLMQRSILSSILGLKRKPRPSVSGNRNASEVACSSSSIPRSVHHSAAERTPHDIYREIVVECEQIERSGTSSPLSNFDSAPTSPVNLPIEPSAPGHHPLPPSSPSVATPYPFPLETFVANPHAHHYAIMLPDDSYGAILGPPPPYGVTSTASCGNVSGVFQETQMGSIIDQTAVLHQIKHEESVASISVEEIVKLVVSAMKNSGLAEAEKESPEEILRRKRQQNNEAAARYRKRQREAKNLAEGELEQLIRRNENLRQIVERMQSEIAELKRAVLAGRGS
ncbi:hypothetical protein V3C99_009067 [Haemonchus contortus]